LLVQKHPVLGAFFFGSVFICLTIPNNSAFHGISLLIYWYYENIQIVCILSQIKRTCWTENI